MLEAQGEPDRSNASMWANPGHGAEPWEVRVRDWAPQRSRCPCSDRARQGLEHPRLDEQLKAASSTRWHPDDRTRLVSSRSPRRPDAPPEERGHAPPRRYALPRAAQDRQPAPAGLPRALRGRSMTPEYVSVRPEMTVAEALAHIREQGPQERDHQHRLRHRRARRLLGDVPLAEPRASPPHRARQRPRAIASSSPSPRRPSAKTSWRPSRSTTASRSPSPTPRGHFWWASSPSTTSSTCRPRRPPRTSRSSVATEALDAPYLDTDIGHDAPQARRLARRALRRRDAHGHGDVSTTSTRSSARWCSPSSSPHHLVGGQLGLAGDVPHHPRDGRPRGAALRLVARVPAGGAHGRGARAHPRRHRLRAHPVLADGGAGLRPHYTRVALTVAFSLVGVVLFGSVVGSMLPFIAAAGEARPGDAVGALRGHARRRDGAGHLLHRRQPVA
jgi:hypothetical protein